MCRVDVVGGGWAWVGWGGGQGVDGHAGGPLNAVPCSECHSALQHFRVRHHSFVPSCSCVCCLGRACALALCMGAARSAQAGPVL
jgi:hypothetical protein